MSVILPLAEPVSHARRRAQEHDGLARRLRHQVGSAIADFGMIEHGDKVMVCLSGGKDSYTLLDILLQLQKKAPVRFELVAVNLDQKQPDFPAHVLPAYLESIGVAYRILEQDTYSVVTRVVPEGKTMCSLCSRLRRGALYAFAEAEGFTKIALGHHRDDLVATFFLNLFFHAKISAMPPKLRSDDGRHVVIRPLAYVAEADIAAYADSKAFPIIPCNLCGSQENLQRRQVKRMLDAWEKETPGRIGNIARALGDVRPSQLSDPNLFDFLALAASAPPGFSREYDGVVAAPRAWLASASLPLTSFAPDAHHFRGGRPAARMQRAASRAARRSRRPRRTDERRYLSDSCCRSNPRPLAGTPAAVIGNRMLTGRASCDRASPIWMPTCAG